MFELDVTAMSGNKSRMELFGPGMQRAEEGAFFSGGPEIQRGANGHTYFASVRTGGSIAEKSQRTNAPVVTYLSEYRNLTRFSTEILVPNRNTGQLYQVFCLQGSIF